MECFRSSQPNWVEFETQVQVWWEWIHQLHCQISCRISNKLSAYPGSQEHIFLIDFIMRINFLHARKQAEWIPKFNGLIKKLIAKQIYCLKWPQAHHNINITNINAQGYHMSNNKIIQKIKSYFDLLCKSPYNMTSTTS